MVCYRALPVVRRGKATPTATVSNMSIESCCFSPASQELKKSQAKRPKPTPVSAAAHSSSSGSSSGSDDEVYTCTPTHTHMQTNMHTVIYVVPGDLLIQAYVA